MGADPLLDLWALDEVRFQQHGSRCRMWIPPENRDPVVLHHPTRKSVGYFGALRLRDGRFLFQQEEERFNAETYFRFLQRLHTESRECGKQVVVILDNARYHHATLHRDWRESRLAWFRCEFLPPYSPELNPIERVWKLVRRLCIHNRYFPHLQDIVTTVEQQCTEWNTGSETLRRLCATF